MSSFYNLYGPKGLPKFHGDGDLVEDTWFDTFTGLYKELEVYGSNPGVWSIGASGAFNTMGSSCCGTQQSCIHLGGNNTDYDDYYQEFDGVSWSVGTYLGFKTQYGLIRGTVNSATLVVGNNHAINTFTSKSFDGVSWSDLAATPNISVYGSSSGTENDLLCFAHYSAGGTMYYDGVSWTAYSGSHVMNTYYGTGGGTSGAYAILAHYAGGHDSKIYDGTSWAAAGDTLSTRAANPSSFGNELEFITFGGTDTGASSYYDGAVWSSAANALYLTNFAGTAGTSKHGHLAGSPTTTNSQLWDQDELYKVKEAQL